MVWLAAALASHAIEAINDWEFALNARGDLHSQRMRRRQQDIVRVPHADRTGNREVSPAAAVAFNSLDFGIDRDFSEAKLSAGLIESPSGPNASISPEGVQADNRGKNAEAPTRAVRSIPGES
jgi:hypothetical protein